MNLFVVGILLLCSLETTDGSTDNQQQRKCSTSVREGEPSLHAQRPVASAAEADSTVAKPD